MLKGGEAIQKKPERDSEGTCACVRVYTCSRRALHARACRLHCLPCRPHEVGVLALAAALATDPLSIPHFVLLFFESFRAKGRVYVSCRPQCTALVVETARKTAGALLAPAAGPRLPVTSLWRSEGATKDAHVWRAPGRARHCSRLTSSRAHLQCEFGQKEKDKLGRKAELCYSFPRYSARPPLRNARWRPSSHWKPLFRTAALFLLHFEGRKCRRTYRLVAFE